MEGADPGMNYDKIDKKARKVGVSIKALQIAEEKEAVAQYGSQDSGASLGDILGAALASGDDKETSNKVTETPDESEEDEK